MKILFKNGKTVDVSKAEAILITGILMDEKDGSVYIKIHFKNVLIKLIVVKEIVAIY